MTHLLNDGTNQLFVLDHVISVLRVGSVTSVIAQVVTNTDVRFRFGETGDVGANDVVLFVVVAQATENAQKVGTGGEQLVSRDKFAGVGDGRREGQGQRQGEKGEKGETHR